MCTEIISKMALIYLLYSAVVFYWQIKIVKAGKSTKRKAIGLYTVYTIAPIILYGIVFITLVGVEELTDTAIIGEGYARTLPFVIAGGFAAVTITTLLFLAVVLAMKTNKLNST